MVDSAKRARADSFFAPAPVAIEECAASPKRVIGGEMKICATCSKLKPKTAFSYGRSSCKPCHSKNSTARNKKRADDAIARGKTWICTKCDEPKSADQFYNGARYCYQCLLKGNIERRKKRGNDAIARGDTTCVCSACSETKPIDQFLGGRTYNCKDCRSKSTAAANNTLNGRLMILLNNANLHATTRGVKDANSGKTVSRADFDLTLQDMHDMWERQCGCCFYSGIPMSPSAQDWRVSLERLDPFKGYVVDNCALVVIELNNPGQWSHAKVSELLAIRRQLSVTPFNRSTALASTEKQFLGRIVNCARKTSKQRQGDRSMFDVDKPSDDNGVYANHLEELYMKQNGVCAYSGVPLILAARSTWKASLERIDVRKGYVCDNVLLVAFEFNSIDNTSLSENGVRGWSDAKFETFIESVEQRFKLAHA